MLTGTSQRLQQPGLRRPIDAARAPFAGARPRPQPAAAAKAAAAAASERLSAALDALLDARHRSAPQPDVDALIADVQSAAADAGANRVIPELNDGEFEGFTLTGRMAKMFSGNAPMTLSMLSFGLYQPGDLKVRPTGGDAARVFKGERFGRPNAYVISTPVVLEEAGVAGVSHAVATYHPVEGNPRRLEVRFSALRLEPNPARPDDLGKWLAALADANPGMDRATGALEVATPDGAMPHGWMDYSAMTRDYQLVTGNAGSTTLLRRVG